MKFIELTQGKKAIVDDENYAYFNKWKWCYVGGYAVRRKGKSHTSMHREIVNNPKRKIVDHINRNKLDNRIENLRVCNKSENARNSKSRENTTSTYKGVSWNKKDRRWRAAICVNYKSSFIGNFLNEKQAALAHDLWADFFHREFANTNFKKVGGT